MCGFKTEISVLPNGLAVDMYATYHGLASDLKIIRNKVYCYNGGRIILSKNEIVDRGKLFKKFFLIRYFMW